MAIDLEGVESVPPEELARIRLDALRKKIAARVVQIDVDWTEASTGRARLVQIGMLRFWLPVSQILGEVGPTLAIPRWLAEEKGIPYCELKNFEIVEPAKCETLPDDDIPF